jgi:hypothetical protein
VQSRDPHPQAFDTPPEARGRDGKILCFGLQRNEEDTVKSQ